MITLLHITRVARVAPLVFLVAFAFLGSRAYADNLQLGANYTSPISMIINGVQQNEGGGPVSPSYLNGNLLTPLYCVDLFRSITVPGTYGQTTVTDNGVVNGGVVNNAGAVAWILNNLAPTATTFNQHAAVQALIWTKIYEGTGTSVLADSTASWYGQYTAYLGLLGSNTLALNTVRWFTPGNGTGSIFQGLADANPVPIPAALLFVGPALIGVFGVSRRKSSQGAV